MATERVTISLPDDLVEDIDRREKNRSKFIREAIEAELERRRREALRRSLESPHEESHRVAETGLEEWVGESGDADLLDPEAGRDIRWVPGEGWVEDSG